MCETCKALDDKIARYRYLSSRINDQQTLEGLKRLIEEMESKKKSYTPKSRTCMAESFGDKFTVAEVTADDLERPKKELWGALAKPHQALTLVLAAVPEGWTAEVATGQLTPKQSEALRKLHLEPGEVRKLTK